MPLKPDHEDRLHGKSSTCCDTPLADADKIVAIASPQGTVWRIATMDCSAEENEIRRALEPITGIRLLNFQLGARTLAIDANEVAVHPALEANRRAGFSPQPVTSKKDQAASGKEHDDRDHAGRDHASGASSGWSAAWPLKRWSRSSPFH